MSNHVSPLLWQFPLTVLVCVVSSLAGAWAVSRLLGFDMNASVVASLSAVLSSAFIARDLRSIRQRATRPLP